MISPLWKALVSEVTVWVVESLFVQVTSVPFFTVISEGLKLKFSIETVFELFADGVLVFVVVEVVDLLFLFIKKKPATPKMIKPTTIIKMFLISFILRLNFFTVNKQTS